MGINRNIVECKSYSGQTISQFSAVLIETLWNVNFTVRVPSDHVSFRINRNIVECKYAFAPAPTQMPGARINRNIVECKSLSFLS